MNWAIIIGINQYRSLPNLNFAERDAQQIANFLQHTGKFQRILLFSDNSPPASISGQATHPTSNNLRLVFQELFEGEAFIGEQDRFWFFFSGHGTRYNGCDYLIPQDVNRDSIEDEAINIHYITERLLRSGAGEIILIIDVCRKETAGIHHLEECIGRRTAEEARNSKRIITFFSCSEHQYSYEIAKLQQGAFTHVLLQGLKSRKYKTFGQIGNFLGAKVPALVHQYRNDIQTPYNAGPAGFHTKLIFPQDSINIEQNIFKNLFQILTQTIVNFRNSLRIPIMSSAVIGIITLIILLLITNLSREPDLKIESSLGEKIITDIGKKDVYKLEGTQAFAKRKYEDAIDNFKNYITNGQKFRNDPEALIYLNNAIAASSTSNLVKIGVSVPDKNSIATQILRGVAHAQTEWNYCSFKKTPYKFEKLTDTPDCSDNETRRLLQVEIANDNGNSNDARKVAKHFVNDKSILGVIGHFSSQITLAAGEVYDKKLVAISPTSTIARTSLSNSNSNQRLNSYIFRTPPNDRHAAEILFDYTKPSNKKAAIIFASKNIYSNSFKKELQAKLKGLFVNTPKCDLSSTQFNQKHCVEQAKNNKVETLFFVPNSKNFSKVIPIINYSPKNWNLLGADGMYHNPSSLRKDMVIAIPWYRNKDKTEFEKDALKIWGTSQVNWRTAMAYDATKALIETLKKTQSREGIKQVLESKNFSANGASSIIKFDDNGDRKNFSGVLVEVNNGKFENINHSSSISNNSNTN